MPPHTNGSSHGQSRIIRQAYHESPMYVPLVIEAYKLWNELENASDKKLLLKTGGIILGKKDSMCNQRCQAECRNTSCTLMII